MSRTAPDPCPCGLAADYAACCGRFHAGDAAPDAERLMRSRYSAYVRHLPDYLRATWHPDTRPSELDLAADGTKWLGLEVRRYEVQDDSHATVEFVARFNEIIPLDTLFVMISGETNYERVVSTCELAPNDYILKPLTPDTLQLRLARALEKREIFRPAYRLIGVSSCRRP